MDQIWRGRTVFLTGHTGFKGAWLSLWLSKLGAKVHGYALSPPSTPSLFEIGNVESVLAGHEIADVTNGAALQAAVDRVRPDIIIHMAAQSLVREGYADPVTTYATNVMGTVNVLEAARHQSSVRAVLVITTDKCYENRGWVWGYRENDALGGYDPYSNSKACAELVVDSFRSSFFNPADYKSHGVAVASARAGNVIGGGDWAKDRLIPDLVGSFARGEQPKIRSPHAIRPWQHVMEPLSGYLALSARLLGEGASYAQGWNFGPYQDDARPVSWVADRLVSEWGEGASWSLDDRVQPHEASYLHLDSAKAASLLDYRPRWRLEEALRQTVRWYRAYEAKEDMRAVTLAQIAAFEAAAENRQR